MRQRHTAGDLPSSRLISGNPAMPGGPFSVAPAASGCSEPRHMRFRTFAAVAGRFPVAGQAILCRANESLPRRVQAYAAQVCACRAASDLHKGSARATLSAHVSDKYILWSPGKRALTGARAGEQTLLLSMERHCASRAEGRSGENPRSLRAAAGAGNAASPQTRSLLSANAGRGLPSLPIERAVLRGFAVRRGGRRPSRRACAGTPRFTARSRSQRPGPEQPACAAQTPAPGKFDACGPAPRSAMALTGLPERRGCLRCGAQPRAYHTEQERICHHFTYTSARRSCLPARPARRP